MNIKKILSLAMVLLMIFALVGCGSSSKRQIVKVTLSTEDAEAILNAAGIRLPEAETVAAAGTNVKWFSWYDGFHNYDEAEIVNTGYFTFNEKYGCDIEWVECVWDNRFDELANLVVSGNSPDFYPGESNTFPNYALKGVFQAVNDYVDYDDPLWKDTKEFADNYFSIKGKNYIIVTDCTFNNVVAYNRRVMDELGFDDPAELYANDEWTWTEFYNMCAEFTDPDEDKYALDGFWYTLGLMRSCGQTVVSYDTESQQFVSNLDDPRIERAADLLYNISKNELIFPRWNNNWNTRYDSTTGGGMKEGLCLFYIVGTWGFTDTVENVTSVWGDITENELMFVPVPRDPSGDGNYYMESIPSGYCLVKGATNPEGVALLAACERFKILDPTVVSIDRRQLEEKYLWTEEMLEMYDTCKELAQKGENTLVEYGEGLGSKLYSLSDGMKTIARSSSSNSSTWAQAKEKNAEAIQYYVDELNSNVAEYIAGGNAA